MIPLHEDADKELKNKEKIDLIFHVISTTTKTNWKCIEITPEYIFTYFIGAGFYAKSVLGSSQLATFHPKEFVQFVRKNSLENSETVISFIFLICGEFPVYSKQLSCFEKKSHSWNETNLKFPDKRDENKAEFKIIIILFLLKRVKKKKNFDILSVAVLWRYKKKNCVSHRTWLI